MEIQGIRSNRQSAWKTMDRSSWHCTGGSDQGHPQEKEMQKGKMVVWGGLTNTCEKKRSERQRRKGKIYPFECKVSKNSKERLKKAFLSDQCKEIEENNRMRKTRDLFKKIRDTKGTFHAKWSQAPHSSILAWKFPRTEEPGGLQSMGSQRIIHDWVTKQNNKDIHKIYHLNHF